MKALREVIQALRRELPAEMLPHASATLQCVVIEKGGALSFGVVTSADLPGLPTHAVTIQLAPHHTTEAAPTAAAAPSPEATAEGNLRALLERMFGPPGFDNAARASVFCEIIDALSADQLGALLENLRNNKTEVPLQKHSDSAVAMARTRVLRAVKLGPGGLKGGVDAMLEAFRQRPAAAVLDAIRSVWKSQSDWIDTTPPGVRFE